LILEYEIPKYDGDIGQPGFFVPLEKEIYHQKVEYLMGVFTSQRHKRWFEPKTRPYEVAVDAATVTPHRSVVQSYRITLVCRSN
jgi:hypothetical protein